ncbi:hypothetical protein Tco_0714006 [Tanacetum coccineum]
MKNVLILLIVAKILANRLSKVIDTILSPEQSAFVLGRQIPNGPLILAGFMSATTSILINGSPTLEFSLRRGLRQGDPLSPFLFIIVMEGLHMALNDGLAANMFHGVTIGSSGSHGSFKARMLGWKANLLSIGGRLTLIKSVLGSLGIYYLSIFKVPEMVVKSLKSLRDAFFWGVHEDTKKIVWVKWSNILTSLDKGGLGVGSLKSFIIHGDEAGVDIRLEAVKRIEYGLALLERLIISTRVVSFLLNPFVLRLVMARP